MAFKPDLFATKTPAQIKAEADRRKDFNQAVGQHIERVGLASNYVPERDRDGYTNEQRAERRAEYYAACRLDGVDPFG